MIIAVDLDKTVINSDKRANKARRPDGSLDWEVMFDPQLIEELDEPMPGVIEKLYEFLRAGYQIWYISSRPDSCLTATMRCLQKYNFPCYALVELRPARVKKLDFKADTVERLHNTLEPVVLYIDDEQECRDAVKARLGEELITWEKL